MPLSLFRCLAERSASPSTITDIEVPPLLLALAEKASADDERLDSNRHELEVDSASVKLKAPSSALTKTRYAVRQSTSPLSRRSDKSDKSRNEPITRYAEFFAILDSCSYTRALTELGKLGFYQNRVSQ